MKKYMIILTLASLIFSQSEQPYPPLELVSIPTAGTLPKGSYTYETTLSKGGTVMPRLVIGLTSSLSIGISYGMNGIIGNSEPDFNMHPGFHLKYRAFDESTTSPAFLLGVNTQGKGKYTEAEKEGVGPINRYEQKALGFFMSMSKNWDFFGNLGFHIGLNKNFWEETGNPADDNQLNIFFGFDKELNRSFSLLLECDSGLNDNQDEYEFEDLTFGRGKGFVNAGIRWSMAPNILVEVNFNDIRKTSNAKYVNREIKIMYSESF